MTPAEQTLLELAAAKRPGGQGEQTPRPAVAVKKPAKHAVHEAAACDVEASGPNVPAAQSEPEQAAPLTF